jgi:hypothetical protein
MLLFTNKANCFANTANVQKKQKTAITSSVLIQGNHTKNTLTGFIIPTHTSFCIHFYSLMLITRLFFLFLYSYQMDGDGKEGNGTEAALTASSGNIIDIAGDGTDVSFYGLVEGGAVITANVFTQVARILPDTEQ